jgi:hypothetical protein
MKMLVEENHTVIVVDNLYFGLLSLFSCVSRSRMVLAEDVVSADLYSGRDLRRR